MSAGNQKEEERKERREKEEREGEERKEDYCTWLLPRRNSRTPKVFFYFRGKSLGFYTSKH